MVADKVPFHVIVIGGGPVGLTLAHTLSAAKIDFTVLERRKNVRETAGAGLGIQAPGARILHQLGILEQATAAGGQMHSLRQINPDGSTFANNNIFDYYREDHGYDFIMFERTDYMKVLYDTLSDKARDKVKFGVNVVAVEQDAEGVTVRLGDGTTLKGDIVIGADGVNSVVRSTLVDKVEDNGSSPNLECTYRVIYGCSPRPPKVSDGVATSSHMHHAHLLAFLVGDRSYWLVAQRLEAVKQQAQRYSQAESDAHAAELFKLPLDDQGTTFEDLYKTGVTTYCADLEEGYQSQWFSGRAVLCGDSAHKMGPVLALGYHSGLESAVALTNALHSLLAEHADTAEPVSVAAITAAFAKYKAHRTEISKKAYLISKLATRQEAWHNFFYKCLCLFSWKVLPVRRVMSRIAALYAAGEILDFVPFPEERSGSIPWKHDWRVPRTDHLQQQQQVRSSQQLWVWAGVIAVGLGSLRTLQQAGFFSMLRGKVQEGVGWRAQML